MLPALALRLRLRVLLALLAAALRGECSREDAVETVKRESCRYAKRQLTWLRRDKGLVWLPRETYPTEEALLAAVLDTKTP